MRNFAYVQVDDPAEASALLANGSKVIAGGTDLLPLLKEEITSANTLVDISRWREGKEIREQEGGLVLGALVTLTEIASHPSINEKFTALAEACRVSASPQLRNMGTLGGNLMQATRCWYYRGPYDCWLKGGDRCYARNGEHELHSIFCNRPEQSNCISAHPSDPATALLALDAEVTYISNGSTQSIPISELYKLPTPDSRTMISLPSDAIITAIALRSAAGRSTYRTVMSRATWTFGLASVALSISDEGGIISQAVVALGGVAPIPIRIANLEHELVGKKLDSLKVETLSHQLVEEATPLPKNGYKVALIQGIFKEALTALLP